MTKRYLHVVQNLVVALAVTTGVALAADSAAAVDPSAESQARSLQLEGTKLQMKGDLKGALEKYEQSLQLLPNPRLSQIAERLRTKIGGSSEQSVAEAAVKPDVPAPEVAESVKKETETVVAPPSPPAEETVSVPHNPDDTLQPAAKAEASDIAALEQAAAAGSAQDISAEEAIIRGMVDFMVKATTSMDFDDTDKKVVFFQNLQISPDYTVEKRADNSWLTTLGPIKFAVDHKNVFTLDAPFSFTAAIKEQNRIELDMVFPQSIPVKKEGKEVAVISLEKTSFHGIWDNDLGAFSDYTVSSGPAAVNIADFTAALDKSSARFNIEQTGADWNYKSLISGENLVFKVKNKPLFTAKTLGLDSQTSGLDYAALRTAFKDLLAFQGNVDQIKSFEDALPLLERLFGGLDKFIALTRSSGVVGSIKDINFLLPAMEGKGNGHIGEITLTSDGTNDGKGVKSNTILSFNKILVEQMKETGSGEERREDKYTLRIGTVRTTGNIETGKIPEHLFTDILNRVKPVAQKTVASENITEEEIIPPFLETVKVFLDLFRSYNAGFLVENVSVTGGPADIMKLSSFAINENIRAEGGKDNSLGVNLRFSGLNFSMMAGMLPTDANIDLKLSQIPALLTLFPDPQQVAAGSFDTAALKQQLMAMLMGADMVFSVDNNHITFSDAAIRLNGKLQQNPSSRTMAKGAVNLKIENPEKIRSLLSTPFLKDLEQPFTMLMGMTEVKNDGDRSVATLNITLTPEGNIMMNNKDMSAMFFPPAEGTEE